MTAAYEMLIADAGVEDLGVLLAGLAPGVRTRLIQPRDDALAAIFEALAAPDLGRLHVLAHGVPGGVVFGGRQLGAADFRRRGVNVAARDLDIAFWCCLTGCGHQGRTFVEAVVGATGARVAAATGLIGSAHKNGSWNLDVRIEPPFAAEARRRYTKVV